MDLQNISVRHAERVEKFRLHAKVNFIIAVAFKKRLTFLKKVESKLKNRIIKHIRLDILSELEMSSLIVHSTACIKGKCYKELLKCNS